MEGKREEINQWESRWGARDGDGGGGRTPDAKLQGDSLWRSMSTGKGYLAEEENDSEIGKSLLEKLKHPY